MLYTALASASFGLRVGRVEVDTEMPRRSPRRGILTVTPIRRKNTRVSQARALPVYDGFVNQFLYLFIAIVYRPTNCG